MSKTPGNRNVRNACFRGLYARLPAEIHELAVAAFRKFCADPSHPSLRRHVLRPNSRGSHTPNSVSVSINMQYRAIYVEDNGTNVWYWVGNHNDYETFIGSK